VSLTRRSLLAAGTAASVAAPAWAQEPRPLLVASYPSLDEGIKVAKPAYEARSGERIKLSSLAYGDHHNAMLTSLATGSSLPDVVAVEVGFLGRLVESGALEDLRGPPYNALQHAAKLVPYTLTQGRRSDGALCAMPVDIGPGTLLYRHDLLQQASVDGNSLSGSWEAYLAAGRQVKARSGRFLLPNASSLCNLILRANVPSGQGIFFGSDNQPLFQQPRFEQAFELARQVRRDKLDAKFTAFTTEWVEGFKRGAFVTEMSGAWLAGHLASYLAPATRGLWRASQLPGAAFASWGGSFYAIPAALPAERKQRAWRFIEYLATDLTMQLAALKQLDAYPAMLSAAQDPFIEQPIEFLGGQRARVLWREASTRIPALLLHKLDPVANEVMTGELDRVLEGGKPIASALRDAQRKVLRRARR
jgi:multiple sugar transport system substrate-binding protein